MDSCTVRSWMTYPTFPATRCTPAVCRSWWIPRGAISSRNAGCRRTSFLPTPSRPQPTRRLNAQPGLVHRHAVLDDELRPALDLLLHEALLLARRDRENAAAVALDAPGEFRIGDDAGQRLTQGLDNWRRRGAWREEAEPAFAFEFHETRFIDRGHVREMTRSSGGGHGQALEAPRLDVLLGRRHVVEQQIEAPRHHLLVGGCRALERHVQRIHSQAPEEDRSPDALQGPDSRRSVGE